MKRIVLLIMALLILVSCSFNRKQTPKSVLISLLKKNERYTSLSYNVKFRLKYFGRKDTIAIPAYCKLIKNKKDTIFGGYLWFIDKRYNYIRYYDLDSIYFIDDSMKTITTYNNPKTEYWAITGNTTGHVISTYFLDTSGIHKALNDTTLRDSLSIDKIGNNEYWKISIIYKDDKEITDRQRCLWINPNDSTLKKITFHCTYQGQNEYDEWCIDSIQYDKETPQTLKNLMKGRFLKYQIKPYTPPSPESEKTLDNGKKAPVFSGINFATGKKVSLAEYKGKVVLLDFWYMDCPWCIRAMPTIERIENEYSKKGLVVLGINSFDTTNEAKQKLPDFIKINKNIYPTILTSRSTDKVYNIHAYPTLYLINKRGEIAFSDIGYRKNLDSILEAEINKMH